MRPALRPTPAQHALSLKQQARRCRRWLIPGRVICCIRSAWRQLRFQCLNALARLRQSTRYLLLTTDDEPGRRCVSHRSAGAHGERWRRRDLTSSPGRCCLRCAMLHLPGVVYMVSLACTLRYGLFLSFQASHQLFCVSLVVVVVAVQQSVSRSFIRSLRSSTFTFFHIARNRYPGDTHPFILKSHLQTQRRRNKSRCLPCRPSPSSAASSAPL